MNIHKRAEEMFDEEFEKWIFHNEHGLCVFPDKIQSFISKIITMAQEEEREKIIKIINSLEMNEMNAEDTHYQSFILGYQRALSNIVHLILNNK